MMAGYALQCDTTFNAGVKATDYNLKRCYVRLPRRLKYQNNFFGKRFQCDFENCNRLFSTAFAMRLHLSKHSKLKKKKFWCDMEGCEEGFTTMELFRLHIRTHAKEKKIPACNLKQNSERTNSTSAQNESLQPSHIGQTVVGDAYDNLTISSTSADNLGGELYLCSHCGTQFSKKDAFEEHAKSYLSAKSFHCYFKRCGATFFSELGLELHVQVIHSPKWRKMNYLCDIEDCGKEFKLYNSYELHIRSHKGERLFSCSNQRCSLKFMTSVQLKNHEARRHPVKHKIFRYECPVISCGKQFNRKRNWLLHKMRHSVVKSSYSCKADGCKETLYSIEALNKHMKQDHPDVLFPCEYEGCGKKLSTLYNLRTHMKSHSVGFLCVLCGEMFRSQGQLNHHHIYHHTEKRFNCSLCDKRYLFQKSLDQHLQKHLDDDPEKICEVEGCGLKFLSRTQKIRHVRRMHPEHRPVKCDVCGAAFCDQVQLARHNHSHDTIRNYFCKFPGCDKVYKSSGALSAHRFAHTDHKPWVCDFDNCESRFKQKYLLDDHIKAKHNGIRLVCTWEGCDKTFMQSSSLKNHLKRHMGIKDFICSFEGCGLSFITNTDLRKHHLIHSDVKPFLCEVEGCTKSFKTARQLRHHTMVHNGDLPFACTVDGCTSKFTHQGLLNIHMQSHNTEPVYACDVEDCGKRFITKKKLRSHKRTHNIYKDNIINGKDNKNLFLCDFNGCGRSFAHESYLNQHKVSHKGDIDTFFCDSEGCGKVFKTLESFNKHVQMKHLKLSSFSCDFEGCDKTFDAKYRLVRHQQTHTGDYPYQCTVENCNRKFDKACRLKDHMLYHSGERNYACDFLGCGKKFFSPVMLKKHRRTVHKEKAT